MYGSDQMIFLTACKLRNVIGDGLKHYGFLILFQLATHTAAQNGFILIVSPDSTELFCQVSLPLLFIMFN